MGKACHNDVLDAALEVVKDIAGVSLAETLCEGEPTSYDEATDDLCLAQVTLDGADVSSPAIGSQDFNGRKGRKITIAAKASVATSAAGNGNHVALVDTAAERLLYVTPCPVEVVANPGTVDIAAWTIEFGPPV